jgi:hypothetical protein
MTSAEWEWCHCISEQNPADHITRGLEYDTITVNSLWWHGRKELKSGTKIQKVLNVLTYQEQDNTLTKLIELRTSFRKIKRIAAIIFPMKNKKRTKFQDAEELMYARNKMVQLTQQRKNFTSKRFKNFKTIKEEGVIKIATRIGHSYATSETMKPTLLHHEDIICQRIMTDIYQDKLHGGQSHMVYEYWPKYFTPAAKRIVKKIVKE